MPSPVLQVGSSNAVVLPVPSLSAEPSTLGFLPPGTAKLSECVQTDGCALCCLPRSRQGSVVSAWTNHCRVGWAVSAVPGFYPSWERILRITWVVAGPVDPVQESSPILFSLACQFLQSHQDNGLKRWYFGSGMGRPLECTKVSRM